MSLRRGRARGVGSADQPIGLGDFDLTGGSSAESGSGAGGSCRPVNRGDSAWRPIESTLGLGVGQFVDGRVIWPTQRLKAKLRIRERLHLVGPGQMPYSAQQD